MYARHLLIFVYGTETGATPAMGRCNRCHVEAPWADMAAHPKQAHPIRSRLDHLFVRIAVRLTQGFA